MVTGAFYGFPFKLLEDPFHYTCLRWSWVDFGGFMEGWWWWVSGGVERGRKARLQANFKTGWHAQLLGKVKCKSKS